MDAALWHGTFNDDKDAQVMKIKIKKGSEIEIRPDNRNKELDVDIRLEKIIIKEIDL